MPRLDLRVCAAKNLPNIQTFGKIDPYCIVELEGRKWRTHTAENTQNPQWDEVFKFNVADAESSQIKFSIWNHNNVADDFLAQYHMNISGLKQGEVDDKWHILQQCKSNAELRVRVMAVDFGEKPEAETPQFSGPMPTMGPGQQQQPPQQQQMMPPPPQAPAQPQVPQPVVGPTPGVVYEIVPMHDMSVCIGCTGGSDKATTKLIVWQRDGSPSTKWCCMATDKPPAVRFSPLHTKNQMFIDLHNRNQICHLWPSDKTPEKQEFMFEGQGWGVLRSVADPKYMLTVPGAGPMGSPVMAMAQEGAPGTRWGFFPAQL